MSTETIKLKITLTEPMLGTIPKDKELYTRFIASNLEASKKEEETSTIQELEEKGFTGFHTDEKGLFIYDYLFKGFLKEAANVLKDELKIKNARSKLDNYVFVFPRRIHLNKKEPDGVLERSLRVMTMQGPRTCLARSEMVNEGLSFNIEIKLLPNKDVKLEHISQLLDYGELKGLGQFRNGSYGRFKYELIAA